MTHSCALADREGDFISSEGGDLPHHVPEVEQGHGPGQLQVPAPGTAAASESWDEGGSESWGCRCSR